jgi:F-type H+-transporting ATPase subunit delta
VMNPASSQEQHVALFASLIAEKDHAALENLLALLAENKRLLLLPEIYTLFEAFREEQNKTVQVEVRTYSPLSVTQEEQLNQVLSARLNRKVSLNMSLDPSLLGGAVIQAGDLVIDGSVRGKLRKMNTALAI